jgi:hypothetical protein
MRIISTTDGAYATSGIQQLAEQVEYYTDDVGKVPVVSALPLQTLNEALHDKMVRERPYKGYRLSLTRRSQRL